MLDLKLLPKSLKTKTMWKTVMAEEESRYQRHIHFGEKERIVLYLHYWLTVRLDPEGQAMATLHQLALIAKNVRRFNQIVV